MKERLRFGNKTIIELTKKKYGFACPLCERGYLRIEYFSFTSDYPERHRFFCLVCKKYGQWRTYPYRALQAFINKKFSEYKELPE